MKKLLVLLIGILTMSSQHEKVKITVSVRNAQDPIVLAGRPVQGILLGFTDTLHVAEGKPATFDVETADLASVNLRHGDVFCNLIVEPGGEYAVCFDYEAKPVVQISDSVQRLRNKVFQDKNFYKYEFVRNFDVAPLDTVGSRMRANFEALLAADKALFKDVKMTPAMRGFIERDLELYWMGSLMKVIRVDFVNSVRRGKQMSPEYLQTWEQICKDYPLTTQLTPSLYFKQYIEIATMLKEAQDRKASKFTNAEEYYDYLFAKVKQVDDLQVKQAFWAQLLYGELVNNKRFEVCLKDKVNEFLAAYPNKEFDSVFMPFVKEIDAFHTKTKGGYREGVSFVEKGDSILTLREVLAPFKGKPVLIDFWFSTCSPCVSNFKMYGKELEKFVEENGMVLLCVSIDRTQEQWQNAIKFYEIGGTHIKACQMLHEDIDKNYQVIYYPHYMLVGADGEILVNRLKDLKEGAAFYDQIREALRKKSQSR